MESKVEQTENAIVNTVIDGVWKGILTQTVDKEGRRHIIHEIYENDELKERKEYVY